MKVGVSKERSSAGGGSRLARALAAAGDRQMGISRLLKKSFAASFEDRIVAVVEG